MSGSLLSRDPEEMLAQSRCRNCGAFVTERFSRVFGDNQDRVHGCFDCMTATDVKNGLAIGR